MVGEIPFKEIKDTDDRSWSLRLVEELARGAEGDREKIIQTLSVLDDRRTEKPLLALVLDSRISEAVRMAASDSLFKMCTHETKEERARWWASSDPVVVRYALLKSEPAESSHVTPIAADPSHSLYHEAIRTMEFWEPPEFQALIIKALDHQNPLVRETAARCLLWEQPVSAESRLLELARDTNEEVAIAALDTLIYCSSLELLRELDNLRRGGPEGLRDCYENTFDNVQKEFLWALPGSETGPGEKAYILQYLKPIRHLLRKKRQESSRKTAQPSNNESVPEKAEVTAQSIIDDLSEVDGMWFQKRYRYYGVAWTSFNVHDRQSLKRFFEHHSDAMVRELGSKAYAAWQDNDAILSSLHDGDFGVLKTTAYHSRFLKTNPFIAKRLKELIVNVNVMNTFAQEALESYIHHANNTTTYDWLLELAQRDSRPSIRYTAVHQLNLLETKDRMKELIPVLDEPPVNTWSVHCEILSGCERTWVSRSRVDYLKSIDNLYLQTELASWVAGD
jgi:hypothetical protein